MKIGIIDADLLDNGTRHPNLALMKISSYQKSIGNEVKLLEKYSDEAEYDLVYVSKVFSFSKVPDFIHDNDKFILGGTGFEHIERNLCSEIEHSMPDYTLYDEYVQKQIHLGNKSKAYFNDYLNYSIGFTTRGCFRKCAFCVNKKYDRVKKHSNVNEFLDLNRKYINLWDDNFLGYSNWHEVLEELNSTGRPFQFRQGLDIRLMTEEKAIIFSNSRYHGDYIFAFDHIKDAKLIQEKLKIWRTKVKKTTKLYVLCAFESTDIVDINNTFERIKILMEYGCLPYIMRYESYKGSQHENLYTQLARWCNQPSIFKKMSFRQFSERNQYYHKNKNTLCKCYETFLYYQENYPELAKEYFDIRFEDLNKYKKN